MNIYARREMLSSWGCYPHREAVCYEPNSMQVNAIVDSLQAQMWIPRGLGRSYGDSALASTVLSSDRLNRFIAFDAKTGLLECQAGVALADIIPVVVPQGWFLAVTPGTKFVTLGGAIASDVHGKNHHHVGCFSQFVEELELCTAEGASVICSRQVQPALFRATCGGMGLTGLIVRARIQLLKIQSSYMQQQTLKTKDLAETIDLLSTHKEAPYSVAWLDCTAPPKQLGRSLIFLGAHAEVGGFPCVTRRQKKRTLSLAAPLLNPTSIKLFNALYYHAHASAAKLVTLEDYFYPLDRMPAWNQLYGRSGFTQYQFVLPQDQVKTLQSILLAIRDYGASSFLSVLKIFGPHNNHYLSFPIAGLTLALDFKIEERLWSFLDQLDQLVINAGGRVYLAKDCRLPAEHFHAMYPAWRDFLAVKNAWDPKNSICSLQSARLL